MTFGERRCSGVGTFGITAPVTGTSRYWRAGNNVGSSRVVVTEDPLGDTDDAETIILLDQ
jgi:hypothetical protein